MSKKIRFFKNTCRIFFPVFGIPLLTLYYSIFDQGVLGIIFSRVNYSPWEYSKPVFWVCLVWWSLELLCGVKNFKIYVKAKIISLFFLFLFCCFFNLLLIEVFNTYLWYQLTACEILASYFFYFISETAVKNINSTRYFLFWVFLLGTFVGVMFCFTLYPPRNFLFWDNFFNSYGVLL